MKKFLLFIFLIGFTCAQAQQAPKREFRAAWIATVSNIDWPTKQGLSEPEQKQQMIDLLDEFKSYNLNTIVFQIRPTADAFYKSTLEPFSHWINGKQGEATSYDPLQFAIDECNKRGMNVHVWLNPYRVEMDTTKGQFIASNHLMKSHPEYFVTYGKTRYFNPGLDETRAFVCNVVAEIVKNYDIEGIHMDDYFYPYKIKGEEFPDQQAFEKYPRGFTDKEDWRRNNVNLIIQEIRKTIASIKPQVEFGISPFGVWRNKSKDPNGSDTKAGVSNYDDLYADILKWQKENWIDYVVPQLYWHVGFPAADFKTLAYWWADNAHGASVYIGQAPYRISKESTTEEWRNEDQIIMQVDMIRSIPNLHGSVYFSGKSLFTEDKLPRNYARSAMKKRLLEGAYQYKSLAPEANRITSIDAGTPKNPKISINDKKVTLSWEPSQNNRRYVIYRFPKGAPADFSNPANIVDITGLTEYELVSESAGGHAYAITALSPTQKESEPAFFATAEIKPRR